MILMFILGSLVTPDIVVWPESTLAIALWVKFKMASFLTGLFSRFMVLVSIFILWFLVGLRPI